MGRDASRRRVGGFPSREEALPAGGLGGIPSWEEALPAGGLGASRRWKRGFPPEGGGLPVVRIGASRFTVGGFPFREEGGFPTGIQHLGSLVPYAGCVLLKGPTPGAGGRR
jgi:hypothetical protein